MEINIILWLQNLRCGFLDGFFLSISYFAYYGCFLLALVLFLIFCRKFFSVFFSVTYIGAVGFNFLLKSIFFRLRPYQVDNRVLAIFERSADFSFPSGHSVSIAVVACFLTYFLFNFVKSRSIRITGCIGAWLLVLLTALSRMYMGQHFLSDVAAGISVGCLFSLLGIFVYKLFVKFYDSRKNREKGKKEQQNL